MIERSDVEIFTGQEYRIDVSSEAGTRFDQNITGFRAEEEFGFNAEPYVRTGRCQKVIGISEFPWAGATSYGPSRPQNLMFVISGRRKSSGPCPG